MTDIPPWDLMVPDGNEVAEVTEEGKGRREDRSTDEAVFCLIVVLGMCGPV